MESAEKARRVPGHKAAGLMTSRGRRTERAGECGDELGRESAGEPAGDTGKDLAGVRADEFGIEFAEEPGDER
jgi:hypothetical protein